MKRKRLYEQPTAHVVVLQVTNQLLAGSQVSADILDPQEEDME